MQVKRSSNSNAAPSKGAAPHTVGSATHHNSESSSKPLSFQEWKLQKQHAAAASVALLPAAVLEATAPGSAQAQGTLPDMVGASTAVASRLAKPVQKTHAMCMANCAVKPVGNS